MTRQRLTATPPAKLNASLLDRARAAPTRPLKSRYAVSQTSVPVTGRVVPTGTSVCDAAAQVTDAMPVLMHLIMHQERRRFIFIPMNPVTSEEAASGLVSSAEMAYLPELLGCLLPAVTAAWLFYFAELSRARLVIANGKRIPVIFFNPLVSVVLFTILVHLCLWVRLPLVSLCSLGNMSIRNLAACNVFNGTYRYMKDLSTLESCRPAKVRADRHGSLVLPTGAMYTFLDS